MLVKDVVVGRAISGRVVNCPTVNNRNRPRKSDGSDLKPENVRKAFEDRVHTLKRLQGILLLTYTAIPPAYVGRSFLNKTAVSGISSDNQVSVTH